MKFSTLTMLAAASFSNSVEGFSVLPKAVFQSASSTARSSASKPFFADEDETSENDFGSKMPTVYDRLGFEEEKIGLGINPSEVLQWLGNRDAIVAKFTDDNKGMDPERIQTEVDKFMMDREMVEAFIAYEKRKSDPRNLREEAESNLTDPSTWGTYAIWITGGAGFAYVKNVIVEPKYQSGEWEPLHITLPGAEKFAQAAADAAAENVDAVSSAVDAASSAVDAASSAM